ncbi:MAG: acyl-CoA reductase [Ruminococcaceae bacterium]|nr:acyl-CoA reductase [Oscillospiraceae bacterium]
MIIAFGKRFKSNEQDKILSLMEDRINKTLSGKSLDIQKVINAIDALGKEIGSGIYDEKIKKLPIDDPLQYKDMAVNMLSKEALETKLKTELGEVSQGNTKIMPLGVIFHIAAGNMEGLPAYCMAEGLLTGNINILKLPQADNDLSVEIIERLIAIEPNLADYIYVFDTPSSDIRGMEKMAALSDGISVWGGDEAVLAVRRLAPPTAKLIEWGHKLGFAYISGEYKESDLSDIALHIAVTKQLLCSSCQVIYLDTEDMEELYTFGKRFLPILEQAVNVHSSNSIGTRANITLRSYTDMLWSFISDKNSPDMLKGKGCSVKICGDNGLELSPMLGNVLVKRLPRKNIVPVLRKSKGYLQTAGLICSEKDKIELCRIFAQCGITKITTPKEMSETHLGEGHDGEYALRRYTRIVNEYF